MIMINKQIVFTRPNVTELVENKVSEELNNNEVLIRTLYTAVSPGTERANLIGKVNVSGAIIQKEAMFPRVLGYSGIGIVKKIGNQVSKVKTGDRVIIYFGKHSRYNIVSEKNVLKICDDFIASDEAAFAVIAGFSLAGIRKTKLEIGESAMVVGLGILGQFTVQILKAAGAIPVVATDPNPDRRRMALEAGADYALDPMEDGYLEKVKQLTKGKGVDVAIEVTGVCAALEQTLGCMGQFGRLALLGCTRNPNCSVDFYHLVHYPGISIIGANNFARPLHESSPGYWTYEDDCEALLKLIAGGRLDFKSLICETHSPLNAPAVYDRLVKDYRNFPVGVVFDWSKL